MTNADILFSSVLLLIFLFAVLPAIGSTILHCNSSYIENLKAGALLIGICVLMLAVMAAVILPVAYFAGIVPEDSGLVKAINNW